MTCGYPSVPRNMGGSSGDIADDPQPIKTQKYFITKGDDDKL